MNTESDAFKAGQKAYADGRDETSNPYDLETDEALDWNDGWGVAADDDLESQA